LRVTPTGRKRIGRPPLVENRRELILETASRLFGKVGFEKCSMQDISESARVSKGTLYHYFKAKQEIYDAIFLGTLRRMIEAAIAAVDRGAPFRTQMVQYFRAHAEYFDSHYWDFNATMLGVAGVSSAVMREEAIELRDRYETILREIVAGGIDAGEFRRTDPHMTARAALSLLNWMPRWYRPTGPLSAGDIAAGLAGLLIDGIATGAGSG
jgi:AcrR family transcriptional regulator